MQSQRIIERSATISDAFKKMDALDKKLLLVMDNNKFQGLVSAGDIQRALIQNKPLNTPVKDIIRKRLRYAVPSDSEENIRKMMIEYRMELCPVVNNNNEVVKVYYWEDLFKASEKLHVAQFNLPVVVMAGGFGTRLRPLTNVLPKPLIPIGEKTMLEHIFDRFNAHGCDEFHVSINYKSDLIEYYIRSLHIPFKISFLKEEKPLGTAGSLSLMKGKIKDTFFVNNCDILIEQDYSEILRYHQENKNEITVVAALKNYSIPYGTVETGENGKLVQLTEKPSLTYKINSGMYLLEPHLLDEIPNNTFYHITNLIEYLMKRNRNVGVFPVSEKSWWDIGEWSGYLKFSKIIE